MKNAFLKKIISAGVAMATIGTLAPLGVSAQWRQSTDSTWSYVEENNTATGWKNISDQWYYFNSNGTMKTGWVYDNGKWYYNSNSGAMKTGWVNSNGTWYYMDKNGAMKTGWIYDSGRWYYADSTGAMQTGVLKINGKTYYFNKSGVMQTGRVRIGTTTYTFAYNGQATGSKIPTCDKEFDSNNNLVKPDNSGNNDEDKNDNNSDNNSGTVKPPTNSGDTDTNGGTTPGGSTNNGGNTSNGTENNSGNTGSSVSVNGLPEITQKYSITVQSSAEQTILKLMNEKRAEAGLQPLTMDNTLLSVARYKSNHMIQNDYFSHTNPDGTKWTNWLKTIGYKYTATAENIAYNSYDAVELFNQWWNSAGHRENMMNPSYTKVGIGVVYGNGKYMGTQE
ncbi:MAG: CAP domain-containing protein, partial [Clostridium sp.]|nr:CAP domain-containing protein [Clostridium sp.]